MLTKAIRVDSDVMETLAKEREGFETPNECLKRLLDNPCHVEENIDSEESEDLES